MTIYRLSSDIEAKNALKELGCELGGVSIMDKKMSLKYIYIKDLKTEALNILKQDALSIGAEVAVPRGVISCSKKNYDAILIVNNKQLEILSKKELTQPFGLKELANKLKEHINIKRFEPQIMGIINANDDSFYSSSRFMGENAFVQIGSMIESGADMIDIGGVSTKPGSKSIGKDEEIQRILPIIKEIYNKKLYNKTKFSIDSTNADVIKLALDNGFSIINDISGAINSDILKLASSYNATYILMHMQGNPKSMQKNPQYENVILDVDKFFTDNIARLSEFGVNDLMLDVGIGFGKTLFHNLLLIKHLKHFTKFNHKLLIGASRKSMIDMIKKTEVEDRLPATLSLHQSAINNGASVLRVHDVKEHKQMLGAVKALKHTLFE
jgi:dihydropteroate synthase